MIPAAEVYRQAHHLDVGDRVIEKDYVLSWLLVAIADSELRDGLAFKGGTALKRCYYPTYRFSEDLDFTVRVELPHGDLVEAFEALFPHLEQRLNLTLGVRSAELSAFGSTTLLIDYIGPLRARLGSRHLKVDVTRGEILLYPLTERGLMTTYSDYPSSVTLPTYTLEEILIEKMCALMGRTEPRDLYDVYSLFECGDVNLTFLRANFGVKSRHKGHDPDRLDEVLIGKMGTFDRLWTSRLAEQVPELPEVDEVMRVSRRHLRDLRLV